MAALLLTAAMLSQVDARSVPASSAHMAFNVNEKAKAPALVAWSPRLSPPLRDASDGKVRSHKEFFGPPFPADYAEDSRPVPDKHILDKLKGPGQPYPALQSKDTFDRDFVKDENADRGAWKAQFEYDALRRKLTKEAADASVARDNAGKEGHDLEDAQHRADDAGRAADDAKKNLDDAKKEENDAMQPEEFDDIPEGTTKEKKAKLEKLKTAVAAAEENLQKEKNDFAECKKMLEDAKTNLAELKAKQVEMEQKLAADTKLWIETKTVRLNLKKSKEDAASSKRVAAVEQLRAAQAEKADMDKILAEKKSLASKSQENLQKEKVALEKAKSDLEKATLTLQKLRGYTPAAAAPVATAPKTWMAWLTR